MSLDHCSRRRFISTSAAAATALTLGLDVRADSAPEPGGKLRWGVIGAGARASTAHIPVIKSFPDMEIVAVCDVMEPHLQRGLQHAGPSAKPYRDYQKLLADPEVDAIVIATPGLFHHEMFLAGLQAGKHVLCEKPMGLNFEQGSAMKSAAEQSDRTVIFGTQLHYAPFYTEMRRQIASGRIGRPTHLYYRLYRSDWNNRDIWLYPDPKTGRKINWRYSQAASGGILSEEGCHYFDLLHWMAGQVPAKVDCDGGISCYTTDERDTWDHSMNILTYPDGCIGSLDMCLYAPNRLEMQVIGESGALLGLPGANSLVFQTKGRAKPESIALPPEVGHGVHGPSGSLETAVVLMYRDFLDCVRTRKQPIVNAALTFDACKTAWLSEVSAGQNKQVPWNHLG